MLVIRQVKLRYNHTEKALVDAILKQLKIPMQELLEWKIDKKSIDARKKPEVYIIYSFLVKVINESGVIKKNKKAVAQGMLDYYQQKSYDYLPRGEEQMKVPPIVIGSGPSGLLCAYQLAMHGYKPILLERGASVEDRMKDVQEFWDTGRLRANSNVQFGEGGAGTFSDGKLNTGTKDAFGRNRYVLELFVANGAPKNILYDSKPHIGTDILIEVVRNIRNKIIELGGRVEFKSQVTDIHTTKDSNGDICIEKIIVNKEKVFESEVVVLAIGHSARDTFELLHEKKVPMEAKSFAVGVRIEHPQDMIDQSQYGMESNEFLPPASYKLATNLDSGRGVYSFCMCPGGYVVNASSEENHLAVNGMSYHKRNGKHANSAIVVTVTPEDYNNDTEKTSHHNHPLSGMYFQRQLERTAHRCGNGKIPVQYFKDFCQNKIGKGIYKDYLPQMKGEYSFGNLRDIFPPSINRDLESGIKNFGRKIRGFDFDYAILSGVESRTSSPVKIPRNQDCESEVKGLYPCGEGAGYAGGITSAAVDGIKVFESISGKYKPHTF